MAEKIERKISRVMRWLERCASSCRGESYGSALMDIECARADFDSARDEIWNAAHKQYDHTSGKSRIIKFFRATAAAAVILLSAAAPISLMENNFSHVSAGNSLEWVNPDEKVLLRNIREQLSNANSGWVSLTDVPMSAPAVDIAAARKDSPETRSEAAANSKLAEERPLENEKNDIKDETKIFTLLKIGENALRNKPSAVTIER